MTRGRRHAEIRRQARPSSPGLRPARQTPPAPCSIGWRRSSTRRRPWCRPTTPAAAGRSRSISTIRRTRPRCARWSASRPAPEAANALTFETLAAKDWVKASQEGLKPVEAGRFIVHSEHYRASVRAQPHRHRDRDRASPSAPDITAPRGDACWRSTIFSRRDGPGACWTSAPEPACSRSRPPGCCAARCWRATSTAARRGVARENVTAQSRAAA